MLNPTILALSGLVGITTTVILFCAHFHQVGFIGVWLICSCGPGSGPLPNTTPLAQPSHRILTVPTCLPPACPQIEGDQKHGKMSPLVRLGTKKGTEVRGWADGVGKALASLGRQAGKPAGGLCLHLPTAA